MPCQVTFVALDCENGDLPRRPIRIRRRSGENNFASGSCSQTGKAVGQLSTETTHD